MRVSILCRSSVCFLSRSPPLGVLDFHWFIVKSIALFALPCLHNSTVERSSLSSSEAQPLRHLNFPRCLEQAVLVVFFLMAKIVNGSLCCLCESNVRSLKFYIYV